MLASRQHPSEEPCGDARPESESRGGRFLAYIATVPESRAGGELAAIYEVWRQRLGVVPNIVRAVSLRPAKLAINERFRYSVAYEASGIGKRREELIATLVSDLLQCHY